MEALSPGHLVVIAVAAVVLFFGWKQLPDLTRSVARSLRIFRTEITGLAEDARTVRAEVSESGVLVTRATAPTSRPRPQV
jgi:sec-independent protein translocase protein TatA